MAPDKHCIIRVIIAEVPLLISLDMEAYVLKHQDIHIRLMKAGTKGTSETLTHPAHMSMLLKGLSEEQELTMNYRMSSWDGRSKVFAINVFKVGLKLNKDLGKSASVFGAAAVSGKQQ